jgi:hypothetical protein
MSDTPETPHDIPDQGSSMTRGELLKRATAAELALLAALGPVGVADAHGLSCGTSQPPRRRAGR